MVESGFQDIIAKRLKTQNGYTTRKDADYDPEYACDRELLFEFLNKTQRENMAKLKKIHGDELEKTILDAIDSKMMEKGGSLLKVLKHGINVSGSDLTLMYTKPTSEADKDLLEKYNKGNTLSVAEEVWASDKERVDLVIFLNGLAIMSFELKFKRQNYGAAVEQFHKTRNPETRLFRFNTGVLVNFAMDAENVFMTTKLGVNAKFIPFNRGRGEGINVGAGNPESEDGPVSYMWEYILTKDVVIDLISHFIFEEEKERIFYDENGNELKEVVRERFFPRYHQLDAVSKLLKDVRKNRVGKNYLIQHSAGSGKTNTIAWLAYRLAEMSDVNNVSTFNSVIIATDRIVVDRQLQDAVRSLEHNEGHVLEIDERYTSTDLIEDLAKKKIIVTTIQKFPWALRKLNELKFGNVSKSNALGENKFAVIIDEAHSSTAGEDMIALNKTLSFNDQKTEDLASLIADEVRQSGKQQNISMFAFTATPKPTTLQLFGRLNKKGQPEAFHIYSMKQAIEERFIYDVTANYTTYETFYEINKEIAEDPTCKTATVKRQITNFAKLQPENIAQRTEVIAEHFHKHVRTLLKGTAKAMIVTESREEAVKYYYELKKYAERKDYREIRALVAFSGTVGTEREEDINHIREDLLPSEFNKDSYNILVVADKYQTGFDQPKLCAMYVLKKLNGVAAVQTLSRLNRTCPPYEYEEKNTFVLDFENTYNDIKEAFGQYFTTTILAESVQQGEFYSTVFKLADEIDSYAVIEPDFVEKTNELLYCYDLDEDERLEREWEVFSRCLLPCKKRIMDTGKEKQRDILATMHRFVSFYRFILLSSGLQGAEPSVEIHKKYNFITELLNHIGKQPQDSESLEGKISATGFTQRKTSEHSESNLAAKPEVKLSVSGGQTHYGEEKKKTLSAIIYDINVKLKSRLKKAHGGHIEVKEEETEAKIFHTVEKLKNSDNLKPFARRNSLNDFRLTYFDEVRRYLTLEQKQVKDEDKESVFRVLLNNEDLMNRAFEPFIEETFESLRA